MAPVEVSLDDVTVCAPCRHAVHPESHAEDMRWILADRTPVDVPDDQAIAALVRAVRNEAEVSGPITVHRGPANDIHPATWQIVREWVATQP